MPSVISKPDDRGSFLVTGKTTAPTVTVTPRDIGPLDLVFLQDLSSSFGDDISVLAGLVPDLIARIRTEIQADSQFGYASFIDKPLFGGIPFLEPDYVYRTELPITADTTALVNAIANSTLGNGNDFPEAQLDALFFAAVRAAELGFRDGTERFIVITTDAPFKQAGDGFFLTRQPNNGDSIIDGDPPGSGEDYVSISQLKSALEAANITPIFAVTGDQLNNYSRLRNQLGRGTVVRLERDSSNIIDAVFSGIETVFTGSSTSGVNIKFQPQSAEAGFTNELGLFSVDDSAGRIDGRLPGDPGYLAAALERSEVLFTALPNDDLTDTPSRIVSLSSGALFGFYLVADGSTEEAIATLAAGNTPDVRLSFPAGNSGGFDSLKDQLESDTELFLEWEDFGADSDRDFNDLTLSAEVTDEARPLGTGTGELLNLLGTSGPVTSEFSISGSAAMDSTVGYYIVDNAAGAITDPLTSNVLLPGEAGYTEAAIARRVVDISTSSHRTVSIDLQGDVLLAPYLIADASIDEYLTGSSNADVFFAFTLGNGDRVDHVRLLGDNTVGFEDLFGGGDRDFNDVIIQTEFIL